MKFFYLALPFFLGVLAILQAGLNRIIAKSHHLVSVVLFNNTVVLGFSVLVWLFFKQFYSESLKTAPPLLGTPSSSATLQWWYFVPGLAGFLFVLLLPYSIARLGASRVFLMLILAQIIGGVVWDLHIENQEVPLSRYLAVLFALLAALINLL